MFIQQAESILNRSKKKVNTRFNPNGSSGSSSTSKRKIKPRSIDSYNSFKAHKSYRKLKNIVSNKSEVVVKVTGYSKGAESVYNNLLYVTRNHEIEVMNDKDQLISDSDDLKEYLREFTSNSQNGRPRRDSRDTAHFALSFPEASNDDLLEAVRNFAKDNFEGHEYLYALHHEEDGSPHVHLIVQSRSKDLTKTLRVNNPELEKYRDSFNDKIQDLGYESNATSRISRGNFKRPLKQIEYHSKPKNILLKQLESVKESINTGQVNKYLERSRNAYKDVLNEWRELSKSIREFEPEFSNDIDQFVENVNLESRQESLQSKIIEGFKNQDIQSSKENELSQNTDIEIER